MDDLLRHALFLVVVVSGVPILAGLLAGIVSSVLQAATQIQDPILSFAPKLVVVGIVCFLGWPWASNEMLNLTEEVITHAARR